jgi:hypothetical protein
VSGEARLDRVAVELHQVGLQAGLLEQLLHARREARHRGLKVALALDTCTAGASPNRLGSGVDQADQQRDHEDRVLPQRVAVHRVSLRGDGAGPSRGPAGTGRPRALLL